MTEKKENRRVRMSKRLLKEALLDLLEENRLVDITVTSICKTADVHRSTYYEHYTSTADLLKEAEQDFLDQIPVPPQHMEARDQEKLLESNTAFFDYVKEHKKAFRVLFRNSSDNDFASRIVEHLCSGYIPISHASNETSARFIRLYIANGTVGMLREWVSADFPFSSRRIAEMMYFLSKNVIDKGENG